MNILLTSAGRRGYLVEYFKKALEGIGEVHVGNSTPVSPSFYYADHAVVTPLIYDEAYIPFLLDYCKKTTLMRYCPCLTWICICWHSTGKSLQKKASG